MEVADARQLFHRIRLAGGYGLPAQVAVRLQYVTAGQDVVYVDAWTRSGEAGPSSGRVLAFTAKHVAVIDVIGADADEPTIRLNVVPRSALERLEIGPVDGLPKINAAEVWAVQEWGAPPWPSRGAVSLTYAGLEGAVVIPRGPFDSHEDFAALLPGLLDDLSR